MRKGLGYSGVIPNEQTGGFEYILMADVIGSRKYSSSVVENLKSVVDELNEKFEKLIKSPFTITLGDEFQGVVMDLKSAVEILLCTEELLIRNNAGIKLRYVLNFGQIDTPINADRAYEMYGSGLTEARESLVLYKKESERFFFELRDFQKSRNLNNLFYLYQKKVDQWSRADYSLIASYWDTHSYTTFIDSGAYATKSGAWKKVNSLDFTTYSKIKELILALASEYN